MDYDIVYGGDERNAVRVINRSQGTVRSPGIRPGSRTMIAPSGGRPMVISSGSSRFYPQPYASPYYQDSFASRFGMTTGELIDTGIQLLTAITPLPAAPTSQGDAGIDVENLLTYEAALWQAAKRDEQLRTLGGLLVRILK